MGKKPGGGEPSKRIVARKVPSFFWLAIATAWLALLAAYAVTESAASPIEQAGVLVIGAASALIWLNGIRHFAMWATAARRPASPLVSLPAAEARVALVYCTSDDFNPECLSRSMLQDRPATAVILDDSSSPRMRRLVDEYARDNDIRVIRRPQRTGFKAGNLNHGIRQLIGAFDYFVILDSDGVIPPHFVSRALEGFAGEPRAGIVQSRHTSNKGTTAFTAIFAGLLGTHLAITQGARNRSGFTTFMGRGAMISSACLNAAGPLPEVVAEDIAYSLQVRRAGFGIVYDADLVCEEDYPIDYHAFRTQHTKTAEGAAEFMLAISRRMTGAGLRWNEKLDIIFEQVMVSLVAASSLALVVMIPLVAALTGGGYPPVWVFAATGIFGLAPLIPEAVRLVRRRGVVKAATFLGLAGALYASTMLVTLRATVKVLSGGRALFRVTPKRARTSRGWRTMSVFSLEVCASVAAVIAALALTGTLLPALPILGPSFAALLFAAFGARPPARYGGGRPATATAVARN